MSTSIMNPRRRLASTLLGASVAAAACGLVAYFLAEEAFSPSGPPSTRARTDPAPAPASGSPGELQPRRLMDVSGFAGIAYIMEPWSPKSTLVEISDRWRKAAHRFNQRLASEIDPSKLPGDTRVGYYLSRSTFFHAEGDPKSAYETLKTARDLAESDDDLRRRWLTTIMHTQGVTALRQGENDNCIMCRGESSCILPISPAARHTNPNGSRLAIRHFGEYLERFPDDLEVRWLLNLAHMTLGEYPGGVDPRFLVDLSRWTNSEFDIGRFRDIGDRAGVNRFDQAGGSVMDDFDNDGLLDLIVTSFDPTKPMAFYRNRGDGTFEDRSESAGVTDQLGGLFCVQADYDNDGDLDVYIPRGAWLPIPIRPTLLRNNGDGTFVDVTEKAGLLDPHNSNSACWADYDNDGWVDLFVCCETQPNRLYHNRGDGTFEEVGAFARVAGDGRGFCKGATWVDIDNDGDPDLFTNNLNGLAELFRNDGDGRFTPVTTSMGIDGPRIGFSCWAWDHDNDGWLDIFATCYDRTLNDVVLGLLGRPHSRGSNRLYRNLGGRGFSDETAAAGLDVVFAAMGSNYGDFDNDGFLDMYLGTGEPNLSTLVPNRMFKNVGGRRFSEITGSSGTGHLQKGHSVSCGDWDRDGDIDVFIQMGGAVNGDQYHNILFENPGQGNHSLTLKLVGRKTNRAAIGARIKVVTAGASPQTIHRHVSSGSSFGANPLQQTIGLASATRVETLEIHWPTSGTTQVFHDIAADQAIEVTEFDDEFRPLGWAPIPQPEAPR